MGRTKELFEHYNQQLIHNLIPHQSEPIETNFVMDPNEPIFNLSFKEICKQSSKEICTATEEL